MLPRPRLRPFSRGVQELGFPFSRGVAPFPSKGVRSSATTLNLAAVPVQLDWNLFCTAGQFYGKLLRFVGNLHMQVS